MFTVISYDISNDKVRLKVAGEIGGYGVRVQKSVFEAPDLRQEGLATLRDRIERKIDLRSDTIRYYQLCAACMTRTIVTGSGELTFIEEFAVL